MTDIAQPASHPSAPAPEGRRIHSEVVWDSVRDAYLAGETGASAAARHGVSLSAFWRRAAEEGWRRRDRPEDPPEPFDPDRPALEEARQLELVDRRVSWALERGDAGETLRWLRMRDRIELRGHRLREAEARREEAAARSRRQAEHAEINALTAVARDVERIARAQLANVRTRGHQDTIDDEQAGRDSRDSKNQTPAPPANRAEPLDPDAPGLTRAERRRRLKYRARHAGAPDP